MKSLDSLCENLLLLADSSERINETVKAFYVGGSYSQDIENIISAITCETDSNAYQKKFVLNIDGQPIPLSEFSEYIKSNHQSVEYELTFDKKTFIQELYSGSNDVDEILFVCAQNFLKIDSGLGLDKPLIEGQLNNHSKTRIHVYGLEHSFGGPRILVTPLGATEEHPDWLSGSSLPSSELILKQVHVVSEQKILINPQKFELTWGDLDSSTAELYRKAFAKHLIVTLATNFYSEGKIDLKGVKHVQANILSEGVNISEQIVSVLAECVKWCYSKEDPDIPIQLLVDRLSLECTSGNLLKLTSKIIEHSYQQAKDNYKFVIAKRSDDYRKELKDVYTDIQNVTDKFAEKALSLATELLKSLLAIGFIFTVGTVSKSIVSEQLLHTPEAYLLFKVVSVFLVFSFLIRWLNASADLKISEKALKSWSGKLHNHISGEEVSGLIKEQTKWSKYFYLFSLAVLTAVQTSLAYCAYHSKETLLLLGL